MIDDEFSFGRTASVPSVTELLKQFPMLPANALLALAVWSLLSRTVTPQRACGCGCGEVVTGKAKFAGVACRKRLERERNALRATGAKNLNLILQYEIPVPIPTKPVVTGQAEPAANFPDIPHLGDQCQVCQLGRICFNQDEDGLFCSYSACVHWDVAFLCFVSQLPKNQRQQPLFREL